ncbi:MAG: Efflux transporter periplasmic adaptor subunit [Bacteroidetes bacterium]|nr:Efflux transporter periplasmic adaptor subunit [Bacteroidota bacterium]
MKKNIKSIATVLVLIALVVTFLACTRKQTKHEAALDSTEISVKTVKVSSRKVTDPVVSSGFISSTREAHLSFKTGGVIERIYVEEGQTVRKGQLLATLNLTEINSMVEQARQGVDKSQRDYDRAKNLYSDTVATLEQLQNATTGLSIAKEQFQTAKFNQSYSEIRATTDGKIVRKLMNEGEIVSPGLPVFFMNAVGVNDWVVKAGVSDKDWARLKIGNTATVRIDAYRDEVFTATVSQLAQAPDPTSGLYQIELKLANTGKSIATGLFAKAEIKPTDDASYISAPVDAVVEGNGKEAFVFIAENGKARRLPVRVAFIKDGQILLSSGLEDGTAIITDGSAYLTEGVSVKVVQ